MIVYNTPICSNTIWLAVPVMLKLVNHHLKDSLIFKKQHSHRRVVSFRTYFCS